MQQTCDATHRRDRVFASLVVIPPTLHCLPSASLCLASWVAMTTWLAHNLHPRSHGPEENKRENEMNRCWCVEWQGSCLVPSVVQYGSSAPKKVLKLVESWNLRTGKWYFYVFLCISSVRIALAGVQPSSAGASGSASLDLTFKSFASLITVNHVLLSPLIFIICSLSLCVIHCLSLYGNVSVFLMFRS